MEHRFRTFAETHPQNHNNNSQSERLQLPVERITSRRTRRDFHKAARKTVCDLMPPSTLSKLLKKITEPRDELGENDCPRVGCEVDALKSLFPSHSVA